MLGPFTTASRRYIASHQVLLAQAACEVHNDDDNDSAWQRGPLWPHGMGPIIWSTFAPFSYLAVDSYFYVWLNYSTAVILCRCIVSGINVWSAFVQVCMAVVTASNKCGTLMEIVWCLKIFHFQSWHLWMTHQSQTFLLIRYFSLSTYCCCFQFMYDGVGPSESSSPKTKPSREN